MGRIIVANRRGHQVVEWQTTEAHGREPVIVEMAACVDQNERGIDLQIGDGTLVIGQLLQPLG